MINSASTAGLKVYVLKVLYHIADRISPSDAKQLAGWLLLPSSLTMTYSLSSADDLLSRLKGFSCTPADIQVADILPRIDSLTASRQ